MKPMLATAITGDTLKTLAEDDRWIMTQKLDGVRMILAVDDGKVTGFNRKGTRTDFPGLIGDQLARRMPKGRFVIDGELMKSSTNYKFMAFDLIEAGSLISSLTPFHRRLQALETMAELSEWRNASHLGLLGTATTRLQKLRLIRQVIQAEAEGVICRRKYAVYQKGVRSPALLKWKNLHEVDCIAKSLGRDDKHNIVLALVDGGMLREVGVVSSLTGDGPKVKVGDVITVGYLTVGPNGKLREPVTPRLRTDKAPEECLVDQLIIGNTKEILC